MASSSPRSAGERWLVWVLLVLAVAGSVWLIRRSPPKRPPAVMAASRDPLRFVPAGAELVVTVDVEALAKVAAADLLRAGGARFLGLGKDCGFEPLLEMRRLAFAVPARGPDEGSDFALIAETTLGVEPVLRCAEKLITKRGGRPVRSELGRFRAVRDQAKPGGELAIRSDGLFVLSGGGYFRDVLDAINGSAAPDQSARVRAEVHAGLRRKLGAADVVVTLLPGRLMPLSEVQALALALRVQQALEISGFVGCGRPEACSAVRALLERIKADLAAEPELSDLGALAVRQGEAGLELSGQLPRQALVPVLQQLLAP